MQCGNEKQHGYASRLARDAGYDSLEAACSEMLGVSEETLLTDGVDVTGASRVISGLQQQLGIERDEKPSKPKTRHLDARAMRWIAEGKTSAPQNLSDDEEWVLDALGRYQAIATLFSHEAQGVNGDGPITTEQLLRYFGNWEKLAEAFEVTVSTAKSWGTHLPPVRKYEAQILTGGYVKAPRVQTSS